LQKQDDVITIAFFKGYKSSRLHRFIRWWTKSPYSHAELILPDNVTWMSISPFLSSRVGARVKRDITDISTSSNDWDYLTFKLNSRDAVKAYQISQLDRFIEETTGSQYDWAGLILSHLSPYLIKRRGKWYCSEWIAHALVNSRIIMWDDIRLYDTPDLSPGKLYNILCSNKGCTNKQRSL
jgi:hypothetical protein